MHAAFIMITVAGEDNPFTAAERVSQIKNVKFAHPVTGPHDIIAYVEIGREFALADKLKSITEKIHSLDCIEDTLLCLQRPRENQCVEMFEKR